MNNKQETEAQTVESYLVEKQRRLLDGTALQISVFTQQQIYKEMIHLLSNYLIRHRFIPRA